MKKLTKRRGIRERDVRQEFEPTDRGMPGKRKAVKKATTKDGFCTNKVPKKYAKRNQENNTTCMINVSFISSKNSTSPVFSVCWI
jgi:hypothetical protein